MTAPRSRVDSRRLLLGFPGFAGATLALVGLSAWAMIVGFRGPGDASAVAISAAIAIVVQFAAFPMIRELAAKNLLAGWGVGTLIRFLTLIAYAILAAKVLRLPPTAALISLFVFYFLSMVIEPFFLRP